MNKIIVSKEEMQELLQEYYNGCKIGNLEIGDRRINTQLLLEDALRVIEKKYGREVKEFGLNEDKSFFFVFKNSSIN